MDSFISDLMARNNFWHILLILFMWAGIASFTIWWVNALTRYIERKMKERHGTIWWPVVMWRGICRFFAKPKKWKKKQKAVIGVLLFIFLLQHFGYGTGAGRGFYNGCEQVKKVLTLQIAFEHLYSQAQMTEKREWWEGPVNWFLKAARVAGAVKKGADAVNTIQDTKESIDRVFD